MTVDPATTPHHATHAGATFHFCAARCRERFALGKLAGFKQVKRFACGTEKYFRDSFSMHRRLGAHIHHSHSTPRINVRQ
jgi:hypothetical protein